MPGTFNHPKNFSISISFFMNFHYIIVNDINEHSNVGDYPMCEVVLNIVMWVNTLCAR